jgi:hypothetical protein
MLEHAQIVRFQASGSATAGADYGVLGGRTLFQPGQSTATLTVAPIDDNIDEDDEELVLELLADPSYSLDALRSVWLSILDND